MRELIPPNLTNAGYYQTVWSVPSGRGNGNSVSSCWRFSYCAWARTLFYLFRNHLHVLSVNDLPLSSVHFYFGLSIFIKNWHVVSGIYDIVSSLFKILFVMFVHQTRLILVIIFIFSSMWIGVNYIEKYFLGLNHFEKVFTFPDREPQQNYPRVCQRFMFLFIYL